VRPRPPPTSALRIVCTLAVTAAASALAWRVVTHDVPKPTGPASTNLGLTVERVQALAVLTTLKVDVADAVVTELRGHAGGTKAALIVRGDYTIGVDLSAARLGDVNQQARTAVLILPPPRVQSVRLDHERTRLLGVWSSGLWAITPGGGDADVAALNAAYRDAQRFVAAAAGDPDVLARARRQAEHVLGTFFAALGWTVEIRWSGES
jgi:hypothetical protein